MSARFRKMQTENAMRRSPGFTLIEMMITVAILAIIISIALPSYRNYIVKANRTAAKTALVELQARQDGYYVDRRRYATTLTSLGYPANPAWISAAGEPDTELMSRSIYQMVLSEVTATGYRLEAIPVGSQASDSRCGTLSVIASGRKQASGSDGVDCWR